MEIKPYHKNAKKHPKKQIQQIANSIKEFGMNQPVVVDEEGVIIVGHGRWEACKLLGIEPEVKVVKMSQKKANAYRLADNKLNESDWDMQLVIEELKGLDSDELVELTGFDKDLLIEPDEKDDIVPENAPTRAKLGDIWQLGRHRVMCGDSTKKEDVEKLMDGKKARICFTSPPYWLGFEYEQEKNLKEILNHIDKSSEIMSDVVRSKIIINTGNIASITKAQKITGKKQVAFILDWWRDALNKSGFLLRHIRIWAKEGQMRPSSRNDSVDMHWEYFGLFTEEDGDAGFVANFYAEDREFQGQNKLGKPMVKWATSGIWTGIHGNARSNNHVAAFPAEIGWRHLLMYTDPQDLIYEPYGGSGTMFIAAEKTGRVCYGMELDQKYVDVIIQRWEDYTGQVAELTTN